MHSEGFFLRLSGWENDAGRKLLHLSRDRADSRNGHQLRKHWYIENKLHWVLYVGFKEDYAKAREGNVAENPTKIKKIALNAMKLDNDDRCSLKIKRKKAAWDDAYALKIMLNIKS